MSVKVSVQLSILILGLFIYRMGSTDRSSLLSCLWCVVWKISACHYLVVLNDIGLWFGRISELVVDVVDMHASFGGWLRFQDIWSSSSFFSLHLHVIVLLQVDGSVLVTRSIDTRGWLQSMVQSLLLLQSLIYLDSCLNSVATSLGSKVGCGWISTSVSGL